MNPLEWQAILSTVSTLVGLVAVVWVFLRFLFRDRWEDWLEKLRAPITTQIGNLRTENGKQHEAAETSRKLLAERVEAIATKVSVYHRENQRGHGVMLRKLLGRPRDEAEELLAEIEEYEAG